MIRPLQSVIYLVALVGLPTLSSASDGEAAAYVQKCKLAVSFAGPSTPNAFEAIEMGFCLGLMDGLRGANYFLKKSDPASAFCEPANFDNVDLAKTFVASVGTNPELKGLRGALAAQIALAAVYPCRQERK